MPVILDETLTTLAFAGLGFILLAGGYLMLDLLTPGRLGRLVFTEHRRDAAIVTAANLLSLGAIIATAIYTAEASTLHTLAETATFGLLGIGMLGLAFLILDLLTPGKLGETITDEHDDPAVWVIAASQLAVALIVIASLT